MLIKARDVSIERPEGDRPNQLGDFHFDRPVLQMV
jgi:hypothetical protein